MKKMTAEQELAKKAHLVAISQLNKQIHELEERSVEEVKATENKMAAIREEEKKK